MNEVFATRAFWQPYLYLEPEGVTAGDFVLQLEKLGKDFPIHEEIIPFEFQGRQQTALRRFVEFSFSCGERFSLIAEYEPDKNGCSTYWFLADAESGEKGKLGWSDLARWHPYFLRPEELDALIEFWSRTDPRWPDRSLPLLLLCPFVGLPELSARDVLAARASQALQALALRCQLEIPLHVPSAEYRWELDPELGWVFTSDEYCCYSIRNRPHADSDEGRFPFEAFREMMAEVQHWIDRH